MIRCEVLEKFSLRDFDKLSNIKRKSVDVKGELFVNDTFECDEKMAKYLTGNNPLNKIVVKVIEVTPEELIPVAINDPVGEKGKRGTIEKTSKKKKTSKK